MTIDLTAAAVRPAAGTGLASRTAAGFVALGSADAAELLRYVDEHQTDPDLIEQLANRVVVEDPRALALLFTAGGEPWLLAWGAAVASIVAPTMRFTVTPVAGEVLVHQLPVDAEARIVLSDGVVSGDPETGPINLAEGSMPAGAVVIDLTEPRAAAAPATPAVSIDVDTNQAPPPAEPTPVVDDTPMAPTIEPPRRDDAPMPEAPPLPTTPSIELPVPPAVPASAAPAATPAAPSVAVPAFDVPYGSPSPAAAPSVEPPAVDTPGQPAAQGIVFADDLEEISDLIDTPAADGGLTSITLKPTAPAPEPPATAFLTATQQPAAEPQPTPPAPPVLAPVEDRSRPGSLGPELVLGIGCPNGHHNHPEAAFCTTCGARMGNDDTTVLVNGPRPPLGVLVADDGETWSIETDMVLGRDPNGHADVRAGTALPVPLADDTVSMSRQHACIRLDEWAVALTDLGSSNGTCLRRGGEAADWIQVTADAKVDLEPGDEIRLGGRSLQVELHHKG